MHYEILFDTTKKSAFIRSIRVIRVPSSKLANQQFSLYTCTVKKPSLHLIHD